MFPVSFVLSDDLDRNLSNLRIDEIDRSDRVWKLQICLDQVVPFPGKRIKDDDGDTLTLCIDL
jgi:hypothetical protein